jgi:NADPH:quinone reductase-like Zn-dependent oxidoreductase
MGRDLDGGYAEYTLVPANQVQVIHSRLDWATLGAMPEVIQTAWDSLSSSLHVKTGQALLLRGGITRLFDSCSVQHASEPCV